MIKRFLKLSHTKAARLLVAFGVACLAQQGLAAGGAPASAPAPNALPTGGRVVAGNAAITQSNNTMNVNQTSQRAVVNWNSFDVGSKSTVNFNQPNASAATLNVVNSASKSMIDGAVNANGQVIFVNNNGVVFGKNAEVNAGAVVATTMNTNADEFMAGKSTQTYEGGSKGKVINRGRLTVTSADGYIALMAPQVQNTGVISATLGGANAVALVAGQKVSLTFSGSQLVSVSVDASVVNALIKNKLLIQVGEGQVIIAANSANDLMGSVIKNVGTISANSISKKGGVVSLSADTVTQAGEISANSDASTGGQIAITGNTLTLAAGSKTSATGAAGGGQVLIGTNSAKPAQTAQLATSVTLEAGAIVDASATKNGSGGNVAIWSSNTTTVNGTILAKGGAQGGNGGFIETSSRGTVNIGALFKADTSALAGKTGQWLLDPIDLVIDAAAAQSISTSLDTSNVTLDVSASVCPSFGTCSVSNTGSLTISQGATISSTNTQTALNLLNTGGTVNVSGQVTAGSVSVVASSVNVSGSTTAIGGSAGGVLLSGGTINVSGAVRSNGSTSTSTTTSGGTTSGGTTSGTTTSGTTTSGTTTSGTTTSGGTTSGGTSSGGTSSGGTSSGGTSSGGTNSGGTTSGGTTSGGTTSGGSTSGGTTSGGSTSGSSSGSTSTTTRPNYTGAAGTVAVLATGAINVASTAAITANGTQGGSVSVISTGSSVQVSGFVSAIGVSTTGGQINLTGQTSTQLTGATVTAFGQTSGGQIQIGTANQVGSGSTLAPPAVAAAVPTQLAGPVAVTSQVTTLDTTTVVRANASTQTVSATTTTSTTPPSVVTPISTGGQIYIAGQTELNVAATVKANGDNGGLIVMSSPAGTYQNTGFIQTNGGAGLGGTIAQSGLISTTLTGATVEANGYQGGGNILTGRDFKVSPLPGSAAQSASLPDLSSVIPLPTSQSTTIDQASTLSANAINAGAGGNVLNWGDNLAAYGTFNAQALGLSGNGGLVETSGNQLAVSGAIVNASAVNGIAGQWLLDPNNVTISATATSGGTLPNFTAGSATSYVSTADIQAAINAGTSVRIVATGTITQSSALALNYSGVSGVSLTMDNHLSQAQAMAITGATTQSGSGTINLNYYAGGALNIGANITSTSGKLNIIAQSFYSTNAFAGQTVGNNVYLGTDANGLISFVTRGGYIVIDGTGGTITNAGLATVTSSMGAIQNGVAWTKTNFSMNTTNDGASVSAATTGGGNIILTTSRNSTDGNGYGAWEPGSNQVTDAGGSFLANIRVLGAANIGYTPGGYATTSPIRALGDLTINISGNPSALGLPGIYVTSPFTSYAGSINLNSSASIFSAGINVNAAMSAATGVNLTATNGTGPGVVNTAIGTIITTGGSVNINATTNATVASVSLVGLVTAPNVSITANNTNAAGKGVSVTGGITISALNAGVTNTYTTAGDALAIQSTVGTAGNTGGISVTTGPITNNSNGGNVSFISNGDLTVSAAVNFATANTTNHSQTITYDTRSGDLSSSITTGTFTYNATGATQGVNFVEESKGSNLTIGTTTVSGYILVDNTNNGTTLAANATTGTAITVSGALTTGTYAGTNAITLNAIAGAAGIGINDTATTDNLTAIVGNINLSSTNSTGAGITYASPITATSGTVTINSTSTTGATIAATGLISGLAITVNGTATTAATITSLGALTVNDVYAAGTTAAPAFVSISSGSYIGTINALPTLLSGSIAGTNTGLTGNIQAATVVYAMAGNTATNANYLLGWGAAVAPLTRMVELNLQLLNNQLIATEIAAKTSTVALITGGSTNINTLWASGLAVTTQATSLATAGYGIANIGFSGSPVFTNAATGALVVTGNASTAGSKTGISQTGAITQNANGGSVSFTSNNSINQVGAIALIANTSGTASDITYNTTSGNNLSTITSGAISITGTSSAAINFSELTNGAPITTASISVPGFIKLDNTCPTCTTPLTPASATSAMTTTAAITVGGALSSDTYIYLNGLNNAATAAVVLAANTLTVTSASTAANVITVIANHNTANIGNPGITSSGAIAIQSNGGSMLFQSNGDITQSGVVTVAAHTSGTASSITYDTTSGNKNSTITAGTLTLTGGASASSVAINYVEKAAGGVITVSALSMPGSILLDNTYGCTGVGCTPVSGFITIDNAATYATTANNGIQLNGALSTNTLAGVAAITINAATNAAASNGFNPLAAGTITAATGDVNITGISTGNDGIEVATSIKATLGNVNLIGVTNMSSGTVRGIMVGASGSISAGNNINLNGSSLAVGVSGGGIGMIGGTTTIVAGGDLALTGYSGNTSTSTFIYGMELGWGGAVYLKSGGNTTVATSTALSANTSSGDYGVYFFAGVVTNIGGNLTVIGSGLGTVSNSANASIVKAAQAIPNSASTGSTGIENAATGTYTDGGVTYTGISATGNINMIGNGANAGISSTAPMKSTNGNVTLTGTTTTGFAVKDTALITGNSITVNGTATGVAPTVVSLATLTINACTGVCTGHDISVSATDSTPGANTGITQSGAITDNASGSNVSFISNNSINQTGAMTLVANTSGAVAQVKYDTTTGNKLSSITTGVLTFPGSTTNYINYSVLTSGAPIIIASAFSVPGSITLDNTYLAGVQGGINATNAWTNATTTATGIAISASLTATNGIYIRGAVGSATATTAATFDAVTISAATSTTIQTTGTFTAGSDAINIVGIVPVYVGATTAGSNAVKISGTVAINNNSTLGNTNIVAYTGHYNDIVAITNASTAGAIEVSAIGVSADIIAVAGTLFTQNSNGGVYIASSNNGNVSPPKIVNNGTGPVVIAAGAYLPVATATGGQIVGVSGNTVTSASGNVYLYSGAPTSALNSLTATSLNTLAYIAPSLSTLTFDNTIFSQAYNTGDVPATLIPDYLLNIVNIPHASTTTTSAYGPVIQFRIQPSYQIVTSGNLTKVYGTSDPLNAVNTVSTTGSLENVISSTFVKVAATNPGYAVIGGVDYAVLNVNGVTFNFNLTSFLNTITGTRASYGTLAGEQVTTGSAGANPVYAYTLSSSLGIVITHGIQLSTGSTTTTGPLTLAITPATLTVTDNGASSTYAGSTYGAIVTTAGYSVSGLISSITEGASTVLTGDAVSAVTQALRSGSTIASGTLITSASTPGTTTVVPAATTYNALPSAATGSGLSNYTISYVGNTYTVTAPVITITALAESKVYGSTISSAGVSYTASSNTATATTNTLGYSVSGSALPTGVTITGLTLTSLGGATTATVGGGAATGGTYLITPSAISVTGGSLTGYTINYVTGLLTVTPKPITVTPGMNIVYGAGASSLTTGVTYTAAAGSFVGSDGITSATLQFTNGALAPTTNIPNTLNVGTYTSTLSATTSPTYTGTGLSNYTITVAPGAVTVTPATLTVTATAETKVYGTLATPSGSLASGQFTTSGLMSWDAVSAVSLASSGFATSAVAASGANAYTITPSAATGTGLSNYNIVYATGALTVTPATLTITATAETKVYGVTTTTAGLAYSGTSTVSGTTYGVTAASTTGFSVSGLVGADAVTSVILTSTGGLATANASVTPYAVSPGTAVGSGLSNYTISYVNGGLTVNPAVLTLTSPTMVYSGSAAYVPGTAGTTSTFTGVNGQTVTLAGSAVLTNANVVGGSALNSTTGLTIASVSGGTGSALASNYVLPSSVSAVTILPATVTVTLVAQSKTYDSTTSATLTAGSSSASTGSYTISGFVTGEGAYITQTVGVYNSANASVTSPVTCAFSACASSVSAALPATVWTTTGSTNLSNYALPTTVSTTGTINKATLTITADNVATYLNVAPASSLLTYVATGLVGSDTPNTAFTVAPVVTNNGSITTAGVQAGVLTPTVTAPNYTVTAVNGTLNVVGNYQLVVTVGNTSKVFGTYNQTQVNDGTVSMQAQNVTAGYCTNCGSGVTSPSIVSLIVTAPVVAGGLWTAADTLTGTNAITHLNNQGVYNFTVTPTVSSYSTNGSYVNVGNYALTPANITTASGYSTNYDVAKPVIYTAGTLSVTPLTLTFAPATPTTTYNGSTAISSVTLTPTNLPAGMTGLSVIASGTYTSPNASTSAAYTLTNAAITGIDASNFVFVAGATGTTGTTGLINQAAITISASNAVKTFDALTATPTTTAGGATVPAPVLVSGTLYTNASTGLTDTLASVTTVYASANVLGANSSTLNVSGASILNGSTSANSNYLISYVDNTTSTINPATITITGSGTYNGSTATTGLTATGVGGVALNITGTGIMSSPNAGTNALTALSGTTTLSNGPTALTNPAAIASNYTIANATLGNVTLAAEAIVITASNAVKTYDSTATVPTTTSGFAIVAPTAILQSGQLFGSDVLSGGTMLYLDPNVLGANLSTVSISNVNVLNHGVSNASNYSISYANNLTSTITPATLTITGTGTYNGSTTVTALTATGVNGQTLTLAGTGTMNSANAGNNPLTAVSNLVLTNGIGTNAGVASNYTIASPTLGSIAIAQLAITVTATPSVKTYDGTMTAPTTTVGTTTVAPTPVLFNTSAALVSGDVLSGGVYAYTDPNVAGSPAKTVTVANVSVLNNGVSVTSNYAITYVNNVTSTINAAALTVSGLSASTGMLYNGGTTIGITGSPSLSGAIAGSPVTITAGTVTTGTLASPNAGTGIVVTPNLSNLVLSNPNYVIAGVTSPVTATVSPAPLTISIIGAPTSVYNGTIDTSVLTSANYQVSGLVSGQSLTITQSSATFNSANVSTATTLTALINSTNATAGNNTLLSNYVLPASATGAGTITPAPLTMTANNVSTFLGLPPSLTGAYTLNGLVGSDTATTAISNPLVTASNTYNPTTTAVGTYSAMLTPTATSSNYNLSFVSGNLTVVPAGALLVQIASGSNTVVYGTYNAGNVSTVGSSLSVSGVNASYCADCALGNTTPTIINLTVTAPVTGSNLWTATDGFSPQGIYNFVINPVIPVNSYSTSQSLKVGTYTLVPSTITTATGAATNYDATQAPVYINGNLIVTPLALTFAAGPTTTYNGSTSFSGATVTASNAIPADVLNIAASGTLGSPNAGATSYAITNALLTGPDAANYAFSATAAGVSGTGAAGSTAATIAQAPITVTATNAVKTYDGTVTAPTLTAGTTAVAATPVLVSGTLYTNSSTGLLDTLTSVATVYADPNVHTVAGAITTNKVLNVTAATVTNGSINDTANYLITFVDNTTSTINPASVTVTASVGAGVTYNGTVSVPGSALTITGVGGQTLTLSGGTATIASPNAGTQTVTALTGTLAGGTPGSATDPGNYTLASPTGAVTVNQAAITISATNTVKVYDTTTATTGAGVTTTPAPIVIAGTLYLNALTGAKDTIGSVGTTYASANVLGANGSTVNVSAAVITNNGISAVSNYNITYAANTTSTITPATLTVSGLSAATGMLYNGTTLIGLTGTPTLVGALPGDATPTISAGSVTTGTLASPNAATGINVTLANLTSSNPNYVIAGPTTPITASVSPAPLTINIIGSPTSVYNGTTTTSVLTSANYQVIGLVGSQSLTITQADATFNSANVSAATTLTALINQSNATPATGTLLSNYILPVTATGAGSITAAALTMTANPVTTFIGVAPVVTTPSYTLSGLVGADTASNAISSPAVAVTTSGVTYVNGATTTNNVVYAASTAGTGTYSAALVPHATISPNYSVTYVNGNLIVAGAGTPVVQGGTTSAVYGTYNSGNVNSAGAVATGVTVTYCSDCALGNVSPTTISLTVTAPASGSSTWTAVDQHGSNPTYSFVMTPNVTSASYSASNNLNVGNYNLVPSALTLVSGTTNFTSGFATPGATGATVYNNGTLTVTPLILSFAAGPTTTYNGTAIINNAALTPSNVLPGDILAVSGSGTLASPNAGTAVGYTLTNAVLSGAAASNYIFSNTASGTSGASATVLAAPITVSASNTVKTYDATTTATGASVTTLATPVLVSGTLFNNTATGTVDALSSVALAFTDPNAGVASKVVTVSGATLMSGSTNVSANYLVTYVNNTSSTINPAPVTISALAGAGITYNGTTTVSGASLTVAGVNGQTLTLNGSAIIASPNAGTQAVVGMTGTLAAGTTGTAGNPANYTLVGPSGQVAVNPAALTVSATSAVKTYDNTTTTPGVTVGTGTVAPAPTVVSGTLFVNTVTGLQDMLASVSTVYADANVLNTNGTNNKTVNVSAASILNGSISATANYALTYIANTTSTINAFQVTMSGLSTPANLLYTGSTLVPINSSNPSFAAVNGTLPTALTISSGSVQSGTVANPNVQYANGVIAGPTSQAVMPNFASLVLSNPNYVIVGSTAVLTSTITPAPLTVSGLSAISKVYDTTTTAVLSGTPVIAGIPANGASVGLTGTATSGSFASPDVANGLLVTPNLSALSLTGPNAGNYSIAGVTTALNANITSAPVTITGTATYNGTSTPTVTLTVTGLGGQTLGFTGVTNLSGTGVGIQSVASLTGVLTDGTGAAANYTITAPAGSIIISPAPITLTTADVVKTFDATTLTPIVTSGTTIAPVPVLVSGTIFTTAGDSLYGILGSYNDIHAGNANKTVTPVNASLYNGTINVSANYLITYVANTTSTILPAPLTANVTPAPVSVNGSTSLVSTTTLSGVVAGTGPLTASTLLSVSATNVGAHAIINGGTQLTGPNASDYVVTTTVMVAVNSGANANGVVAVNPAANGSGYVINVLAPVVVNPGVPYTIPNPTIPVVVSVPALMSKPTAPSNSTSPEEIIVAIYKESAQLPPVELSPQSLNSMSAANKQSVSQADTYLLTDGQQTSSTSKGEVIFVRDNDNLDSHLHAIPLSASGELKFPVPDSITQSLINQSGENSATAGDRGVYKLLMIPNGVTIAAGMPDGGELPEGVAFNASSKTFVIKNISAVTLPLTVKLSIQRDGKDAGEKSLVVTK